MKENRKRKEIETELYQKQERLPLPLNAFFTTKLGIVYLLISFFAFMKGMLTGILTTFGGLWFIYRQIEPDITQLQDNLINKFFIKKAEKERKLWKEKGWRINRKVRYVK